MAQEKIEEIEMRLDVLNGAQAAMFAAVKSLLAIATDPKTGAVLIFALEEGRAELLASTASEAYLGGFEQVAAMLIAQATGTPQSMSQEPS